MKDLFKASVKSNAKIELLELNYEGIAKVLFSKEGQTLVKTDPNAPEKIVELADKLTKKPVKVEDKNVADPRDDKIAELEEKIAELERAQGVDVGTTSTRGAAVKKEKSDFEKTMDDVKKGASKYIEDTSIIDKVIAKQQNLD